MDDGKFFHWSTVGKRVLVPRTLITSIVVMYHESEFYGHSGVLRTMALIKRDYVCSHLRHYIERYMWSCDVCQAAKSRRVDTARQPRPLPVPDTKWHSASVHWVSGLPPTTRGRNAIMTVVNRFSKNGMFIPCRKDMTADDLGLHQHLGTFGMKPPYRFGTHEDDPFASEYCKLDPSVLVIASGLMTGQREGHRFLSQQHAIVVPRTNACISDLRDVVDIEGWREIVPSSYESMQTAPDTSFDESRTPGSAPSYQWYGEIEVACQNLRKALVDCDEELDWAYRNSIMQTDLPGQIARLNRMNRPICGIADLIDVADGIDLLFKYGSFWTAAKMRRWARSAISTTIMFQETSTCRGLEILFF